MPAKSIFSSYTFWFGIGQVILGLLGLASQKMDSSTALTLITTGVGSIGLRIKTTQPVE